MKFNTAISLLLHGFVDETIYICSVGLENNKIKKGLKHPQQQQQQEDLKTSTLF